MTNYLVIVESPAKCKKIESFLGVNYKCIASFGHIRELTKTKGIKCIDIENNYKPDFSIVKSQYKNISKMRECIALCDEVLLATDDDREGEAIAWHICMVFKLPVDKTKRIIFHEITKPALEKAVANPTRINMKMVNSQKARQVLDLLVGYSISPLLWKYINKTSISSLSAGRCQTPALRLVYDNEEEIKKNPGVECYNVIGNFTDMNIEMKLSTTLENSKKVEKFLEASKDFEYILEKDKIKKISKNPPEPLTTSILQQKASNVLGYSPKDTMRICQNLYEEGYITYMRTDSKCYSKEFIGLAKKYIENKYDEEYVSDDIMKLSLRKGEIKETKKSSKKKKDDKAQEAHEAIRPTKVTLENIESGTKKIGYKEVRMYRFIWKTTVQSCMSNALFRGITVEIDAPLKKKYKHKEEQVTFEGWMILDKYERENHKYQYILDLESNSEIDCNKIECIYALKQTKQHYTEAKLVSLLEKKGIGRPSTFSSIISKIQERGYVKKDNIEGREIRCNDYIMTGNTIIKKEQVKKIGNENNKLVIQPLGIIVLEFLVKYFPELFSYEYTKQMEDTLDIIANGKKEWHTLCDECYKIIQEVKEGMTDKIKRENEYEIDENHIYKIARYGPVIETKDEEGKKKFLKVKEGITLDILKEGKLELKDIVETREEKIRKELLGRIGDDEVITKKGKYGYYIVYKGKNYALKGIKNIIDFTLEDAKQIINSKNKTYVREVNNEISIRNGKFGDYIYYKTESMKKPKFIQLKKFEGDYKTCDLEEILSYVDRMK